MDMRHLREPARSPSVRMKAMAGVDLATFRQDCWLRRRALVRGRQRPGPQHGLQAGRDLGVPLSPPLRRGARGRAPSV